MKKEFNDIVVSVPYTFVSGSGVHIHNTTLMYFEEDGSNEDHILTKIYLKFDDEDSYAVAVKTIRDDRAHMRISGIEDKGNGIVKFMGHDALATFYAKFSNTHKNPQIAQYIFDTTGFAMMLTETYRALYKLMIAEKFNTGITESEHTRLREDVAHAMGKHTKHVMAIFENPEDFADYMQKMLETLKEKIQALETENLPQNSL